MLFETHKVIYSGDDDRLEGLLEKEVYFATDLLELCNNVEKENISARGKLVKYDNDTLPFKIMYPSGIFLWTKLVYPIPEENVIQIMHDVPPVPPVKDTPVEPAAPEYYTYSNVEDFVHDWEQRFCNSISTRPAHTMPLIWVKHKNSQVCELITSFTENGVEVSGVYMAWKELLENMVFLDGSPCGVCVKCC